MTERHASTPSTQYPSHPSTDADSPPTPTPATTTPSDTSTHNALRRDMDTPRPDVSGVGSGEAVYAVSVSQQALETPAGLTVGARPTDSLNQSTLAEDEVGDQAAQMSQDTSVDVGVRVEGDKPADQVDLPSNVEETPTDMTRKTDTTTKQADALPEEEDTKPEPPNTEPEQQHTEPEQETTFNLPNPSLPSLPPNPFLDDDADRIRGPDLAAGSRSVPAITRPPIVSAFDFGSSPNMKADLTPDSAQRAATPLASNSTASLHRSSKPQTRRQLSHDAIVAELGSIPMGASALISALQAIPWEGEGDTSADESPAPSFKTRPMTDAHSGHPRHKLLRLHSSLYNIPVEKDSSDEDLPTPISRSAHHEGPWGHGLSFPFKENVIARRAVAPTGPELEYQQAEETFLPEREETQARPEPRRVESTSTITYANANRRASVSTEGTARDDVFNRGATPVGPEPSLSPPREQVSKKLQAVFELPEQEDVLEEFQCWLLRSVLLKGYLYLTKHHICFFAHMPAEEVTAVKSGPLHKKSARTKLTSKFWVILRGGVLSWYESVKDPYFPKGNVSLQYASSCDLVDSTKFKVRTAERNYTFTADTADNASEWVRVINKAIFRAQHEGETVKLVIPLEAVVEVERNPTLEFAETIEVKVVDAEDSMSIDSYFFAAFPDDDYAYQVMRKAVAECPVTVTTPSKPKSYEPPSDTFRQPRAISSGLSKLGGVLPLVTGRRSTDSERVPITPPSRPSISEALGPTSGYNAESEASDEESPEPSRPKGYPPRQHGPPPPGMTQQPSRWGSGWIPKSAATFLGSTAQKVYQPNPKRRSSVSEVVKRSGAPSDDESDIDIVPRPIKGRSTPRLSFVSGTSGSAPKPNQDLSLKLSNDHAVTRRFHNVFALPETEILLDDISGYLYRLLPERGRFYISENYLCFRGSQPLLKTRMVVPIRELYGVKPQKAYRFAHYGLVVIIKGHEELFLEFSTQEKRDECQTLLEERLQIVGPLAELMSKAPDSPYLETVQIPAADQGVETSQVSSTAPSPMFGSATSTMLDFKPEPMKITCLTIGSRGDVQPFIALCKGLQAEGHTCTIATHGEYRAWVEGHDIGFASVGGDPAELMQMCVDNGMFTIGFLKEGLQNFRGWLDDLLLSSWEACQGADLLIESPSAMAGIHIAEALRIPYYRAFTMPWTRTRAYPHAFAVPEHNRGGAYNYMTYVMFDQIFWRAISGQINRWRKNVLSIEPTTFDKLQQDKAPFLYNFSPTVVPPPLDWTEWIHVSGYWFLDNPDGTTKKKWTPPAGLVSFIDKAHKEGKKVVYIGFGSIVVSDPDEMTRCVIDAVIDADVYAIVSKGWSDRGNRGKNTGAQDETEIQYPDQIYPIPSIDHSWLFPQIDAAVHHGGAGTTGASLRAGIPTIIKPFFGDQSFWAERVESLGVGSSVRKLTAENLTVAIVEATRNQRQIERASQVGEAIRRETGVARAIECIYRDLEYARAIIKPPPPQNDGALQKVGQKLHTVVATVDGAVDTLVDAALTSLPADSSHKGTRHRLSSSFSRLNPLSSSGTPQSSRTSSRPMSRSHSQALSGEGPQSDESWSMVSESQGPSVVSSPKQIQVSLPNSEPVSRSNSQKHSRHMSISSLSSLVGQLIPRSHRHENSEPPSPPSPSG